MRNFTCQIIKKGTAKCQQKKLALFANREYRICMQLKPQDILIVLKILSKTQQGQSWSYSQLAGELYMSSSEVHAGVKRATESRLLDRHNMVVRRALEEFLIHGLKYVFPVKYGGSVRGIPTSYAGPPLNDMLSFQELFIPVWPHPEGEVQGMEFSPLYKSVPDAALLDKQLYEYLVLVDAIREGRARERKFAVDELSKRLKV